MTTLKDRPSTALLVVDVQNGVTADAYHRDEVVHTIAGLVDRARSEHVPVVWIQHVDDDNLPLGSEVGRIVPELTPGDGEPVLQKRYGDAFEETDLEATLAGLGVGRLAVTGAQTDECIRSTLHGAITRGYDALLVSDAHTTEDLSGYGAPTPDLVIAHTNLYWKFHQAPGRTAGTATAEEVVFAPAD